MQIFDIWINYLKFSAMEGNVQQRVVEIFKSLVNCIILLVKDQQGIHEFSTKIAGTIGFG